MTDFDSEAPHCHFVTVAEVIEQHEGLLSAYMSAHEARNVIITMQVEMSVGGGKPKAHAAALAVSHDYDDAEELMTKNTATVGNLTFAKKSEDLPIWSHRTPCLHNQRLSIEE